MKTSVGVIRSFNEEQESIAACVRAGYEGNLEHKQGITKSTTRKENSTTFGPQDQHNEQQQQQQQELGDGYQNNKTHTAQSLNNFQPFNKTNPFNSSWCPGAICHNSPICAPCNKRYLFILATGRSGSTSLLEMMNKLPNIQLSGENNDELYIASKLEQNLKLKKQFNFGGGEKTEGAWLHNPVPVQAMACAMQKLMTTIDPPSTEVLSTLNTPNNPTLEEYEHSMIFGAKMVRIQSSGWNPEAAVAYFQENFPCSRYIVNHSSNIKGQVKSRMDLGWDTADYDILRKENEFLKKFTRLMGPDAAQLIDMNEWIHDVSIINNIVDWMGYRKCHFPKVLHDNSHGYATGDSSDLKIGQKCHYPNHTA